MITEHNVHFQTGSRTKKELVIGEKPVAPWGRIPRVSKLMALAIRFEDLIRTGAVRDQAELARLGHVSRARLTQIMMLLQLAPDIQEELMFLPTSNFGRKAIKEIDLRPIAATHLWKKQRQLYQFAINNSGFQRN